MKVKTTTKVTRKATGPMKKGSCGKGGCGKGGCGKK